MFNLKPKCAIEFTAFIYSLCNFLRLISPWLGLAFDPWLRIEEVADLYIWIISRQEKSRCAG